MSTVAVVHGDAGTCQALSRTLPRKWGRRTRRCRSLGHVEKLLSAMPLDAVVVSSVSENEDRIRLFVRQYPTIPLVVTGKFRPDDAGAVLAYGRDGAAAILVDGVDTPAAGELVARVTASRRRLKVLHDATRLLRLTELVQRSAFEMILVRAGEPLTTADVAKALHRSREHVSREFAAGGAPNLKRVIDLARIICAAELLQNPGFNVGSAAQTLRYTSASHLSAAARRIAGVTPQELPRLGARGVFLRFLKGRTRSRI